jgi:hypothetical protein
MNWILDINIHPGVEYMALINLAEEKTIITFDGRATQRSWKYHGRFSGKTKPCDGEEIVKVPAGKDPKKALSDFLASHPNDTDVLKAKIENKELVE